MRVIRLIVLLLILGLTQLPSSTSIASERTRIGEWHFFEYDDRAFIRGLDMEYGDGASLAVYTWHKPGGNLAFGFKAPCWAERGWVSVDGQEFNLASNNASENKEWWGLATLSEKSALIAAMSKGGVLSLEMRSGGRCSVSRKFSLSGFFEAVKALQSGVSPSSYKKASPGS
jgi:hypothetical protein